MRYFNDRLRPILLSWRRFTFCLSPWKSLITDKERSRDAFDGLISLSTLGPRDYIFRREPSLGRDVILASSCEERVETWFFLLRNGDDVQSFGAGNRGTEKVKGTVVYRSRILSTFSTRHIAFPFLIGCCLGIGRMLLYFSDKKKLTTEMSWSLRLQYMLTRFCSTRNSSKSEEEFWWSVWNPSHLQRWKISAAVWRTSRMRGARWRNERAICQK